MGKYIWYQIAYRLMSRTGPEYVTSESELFGDLDLRQKNGDISGRTAEAFVDLYEFAEELGDRVVIQGAKKANFQLKVDAHQSDSGGDPSVFTANVEGKLKIWPAKKPLENDPNLDSIAWDAQDYGRYETKFQSLRGVPQETREVQFETVVGNDDLDRFKEIVAEFVSTCRQRDLGTN